MSFHEHGVLIYLDKDLYKAFIKLQADKGLGRSFAGLLPFTEGLYHLGYLSKAVYEEHVKKYSQALTDEQPSYADLKEKEEINRLEKHYSQVAEQWPQLSDSTKSFHKEQARQWAPKVKNAKLVLELDSP
jgi:hypothetical protein